MTVTLASVDGTWVNNPDDDDDLKLDAGEMRLADAAMFASAGIASGLTVTVDGADLVTVQRGSVVIDGNDAIAGTGVYRAGIASPVTGTLEARDGTNGRIDLVVFRQYDPDVVGTHTLRKAVVEIIKGNPSATPSAPDLPSMAEELARIPVPATGGGAASADMSHRVSAVPVGGGILPAWTGSRTTTQNIAGDGDYHTVTGYTADSGMPLGDISYASGVVTINVKGLYVILAAGSFAAGGTGSRLARLTRNGTALQRQVMDPDLTAAEAGLGRTMILNVGDTISLDLLQSSGATRATGGGFNPFLSVACLQRL